MTSPAWFTVVPAIAIVLTVYVWFVSLGTWTDWPGYSNYHDQLASAFARGHLYLDVEPDPALLALKDPYDPVARKNIPILSDASLYQGKYYLYFGPVPALLVLLVKKLVPVTAGDQHLTFVFTSGVFLVLSVFSLELRKRFSPKTRTWMMGYSILLLGLTSPFSWILGSRAAVHDAAISAGQLFFLSGLYCAFRALDRGHGATVWAVLAGISWAASLGSRITQVLPIAFVAVLWVLTWFRSRGQSEARTGMPRTVLGMLIPMAVGAAALAWYNGARFGSVFETGIRYQLALLPIQDYGQYIFSPNYVLQNAYNYLLMPLKVRYNFPYLWPQMGVRSPILPFVSLSPLYYAEDITGLIFSAPFLLLAFAPFVSPGTRAAVSPSEGAQRPQWGWLVAALSGSSLIGLGFFLIFFWASERYLLDFLPSALLLAVLGFWQLSERWPPRALARSMAIGLGVGLGAISIVVSTLLAIAQNADAFRKLDPLFWMQLNNLFRR
ncbi:MAG TPA: hypothetical protein VFH29_01425 [Anaerolineales bacterium]|nr:hypothetical protein [Anaerolineales bacterium]